MNTNRALFKMIMKEALTEAMAKGANDTREEVDADIIAECIIKKLEALAENCEGLFDIDKDEDSQVKAVALHWLE